MSNRSRTRKSLSSENPFFEPLEGDEAGSSASSANPFSDSPVHRMLRESSASSGDFLEGEIELDEAGDQETHGIDRKSVFSSMAQAVVILDDQQRVIYTNAAHRDLLGLDAADFREGIKGWLQEVCPDAESRERAINSWLEHVWRNQLTRTFPLKHARKGMTRHIEFRSTIAEGGLMVLLQTDVTDELASDEGLRHANLKFRSLFNHGPGGMVLVNQDGAIHDVNRAFLEFSEKKSDDLIGKRFFDILHPDDALSLQAMERDALLENSDVPRKMRFSFPGNGERPAIVTPSYITNEARVAVFRIYQLRPRDTQLLAKLKDLSSKAQALLEAVPDMFVLLDREGTVKDWSPPTSKWVSEAPFDKESLGKPAKVSWPDFGAMLARDLDAVFLEGRTFREEVPSPGDGPIFPVTLAPFGRDLALGLVEAPSVGHDSGPSWKDVFFAMTTDAVLVTTRHGDVIHSNGAAVSLLGQPEKTLQRSSLFQLLSKAPGTSEEFDLDALLELKSEKKWSNLLSVSSSGPQSVTATLIPVFAESGATEEFIALIEPQKQAVSQGGRTDDLAQSRFRSQLQIVTSLFSIAPGDNSGDSFELWLTRLKVLAESMTDANRVGIVHLLRGLADQVSSISGRGLGLREVVISGSSGLTLESEIVTPFALLAGEIMYLGFKQGERGPGPSLYIDVEGYQGDIIVTAKPGEGRMLFSRDQMENLPVIEILVEQIRGQISVGGGELGEQSPSLRLTFPCRQT